jgi:AhpD family alkylhydroperoxidase
MMKSFGIVILGVVALLYAGSAVIAQDAPNFMKETYPEQAIGVALQDMMALQGEDAALSGKERELIGLGVAAQIPCIYCIYFHTKAAKAFGASDAEVKEALAAAAQVRKWSTILNGSLYDHDAWRQEVDAMLAAQ